MTHLQHLEAAIEYAKKRYSRALAKQVAADIEEQEAMAGLIYAQSKLREYHEAHPADQMEMYGE